jgi:hypothetical protein
VNDLNLEKVAVEAATKYVDKIVDGPLGELGGLIQDQIRFWRWKNQVNILLKSKRYLEEHQIEPAKLQPDVFIPIIEAAGNAEDETLAEMFAGLLSSHLDSTTRNAVHPSFAKALEALSPFEARILERFVGITDEKYRSRGLTIAEAMTMGAALDPPISEAGVRITYENLWRLGIFDHGPGGLNLINQVEVLVLTSYGLALLRACRPSGK